MGNGIKENGGIVGCNAIYIIVSHESLTWDAVNELWARHLLARAKYGTL